MYHAPWKLLSGCPLIAFIISLTTWPPWWFALFAFLDDDLIRGAAEHCTRDSEVLMIDFKISYKYYWISLGLLCYPSKPCLETNFCHGVGMCGSQVRLSLKCVKKNVEFSLVFPGEERKRPPQAECGRKCKT